MSTTQLMTDDSGLTFEYVHAEETAFLYEEIFTRRSYLQHGVCVAREGSPVIVDAGANIGLFALACIQENPAARVFAVEPSPVAFHCLERNLATVSTNCVCVQKLLQQTPATCQTLHCYPDAPGESTCHPAERRRQRARLKEHGTMGAAGPSESDQEEADKVAVPVTTVSELISVHGLSAIDLLKIDVEGDELNVLRGIRALDWPLIRQVVLEVHDVHNRLDRVLSLLRRHGFQVTWDLQTGGEVDGYVMVVPSSLCLYYVYATRRNRPTAESTRIRKRKRAGHA